MDVRTFDQIAWAAGLFEGEGSMTESGGRLDIRVKMTDEDVVRRFADVMECGKVYGPYKYDYRDGSKRKPHWVWVALSYEAFEVLELLWPWLCTRRRAQALALVPIESVLGGPVE
jgi:hypothetical protein